MTTICVLGGDGIGPEVVEQAVRVLEALPLELSFTRHPVGFGCYQEHGSPLPEATLAAARAADAVLFGAVTTPPDIPGYKSPILGLRRALDLYANVRPCRSFPHASSRPGIDLVIVRENTEGLYVGRERVEDDGETVISERVITRAASSRIAAHAARLARRRGEDHVTVVHKANVIRQGDGLFRRAARAAIEAEGLAVKELLVDACAMQLLRAPESLGTIVTTNMFGDILSDEACMLVGGLGLACSGNLGERGGLFEPVHGSAPDIAGQGVANPLATILSAAFLLEHLGHAPEAACVRAAVTRVLAADRTPPDLGGSLTCAQVTDAVLAELD
ncbi:MAG: isocitrate/isopropylmalate dehydrogenase family protein [Planctomycetota bacterium]